MPTVSKRMEFSVMKKPYCFISDSRCGVVVDRVMDEDSGDQGSNVHLAIESHRESGTGKTTPYIAYLP